MFKLKSPAFDTLHVSDIRSVELLLAKTGLMQAPPESMLKLVLRSLPPKYMVAVFPYWRFWTLTPVITGGKPWLPPHALMKANKMELVTILKKCMVQLHLWLDLVGLMSFYACEVVFIWENLTLWLQTIPTQTNQPRLGCKLYKRSLMRAFRQTCVKLKMRKVSLKIFKLLWLQLYR